MMGTRPGESVDTIRSLTAAEINALPDRVRVYIHDLHCGYDPRGDCRHQVIELHIARESAAALAWENLRLRRVTARLLRKYQRHRSTITAAIGATLRGKPSASPAEDSSPRELPPCSCAVQPRTGALVYCRHDAAGYGVRCRKEDTP